MNEEQNTAVNLILNTDSTNERRKIFTSYNMDDIQILMFDEDQSNVESFDEKIIGGYYLLPVADYSKLWVYDSKHLESVKLKVSAVVNLDINILERLSWLYQNKDFNGKNDFIDLLSYIKRKKYAYNIVTAVIERLNKSYDYESVKRTLAAYYRLVTGYSDDDNKLNAEKGFLDFCNDCFNVGRLSHNLTWLQAQYDYIVCILIKAYLIKTDKTCLNKFDALLGFDLDELKCAMHPELYLMALYFKNDPSIGRVTNKLNQDITGGIRKGIENTAWDIYHARMVYSFETIYDSGKDKIWLPFFLTNDKGVYQNFGYNSLKAIIIDHGQSRPVFNTSEKLIDYITDDMLKNKIYDQKQAELRKSQLINVDIAKIKDDLWNELDERLK